MSTYTYIYIYIYIYILFYLLRTVNNLVKYIVIFNNEDYHANYKFITYSTKNVFE